MRAWRPAPPTTSCRASRTPPCQVQHCSGVRGGAACCAGWEAGRHSDRACGWTCPEAWEASRRLALLLAARADSQFWSSSGTLHQATDEGLLYALCTPVRGRERGRRDAHGNRGSAAPASATLRWRGARHDGTPAACSKARLCDAARAHADGRGGPAAARQCARALCVSCLPVCGCAPCRRWPACGTCASPSTARTTSTGERQGLGLVPGVSGRTRRGALPSHELPARGSTATTGLASALGLGGRPGTSRPCDDRGPFPGVEWAKCPASRTAWRRVRRVAGRSPWKSHGCLAACSSSGTRCTRPMA